MEEFRSCFNPDCKEKNPQPISNFAKDKHGKDGKASRCKTCKNAYLRWLRNTTDGKTKSRAAAKKYRTTDKYKFAIKKRNVSNKYKKYQKEYAKSEIGKNAQKKYKLKPKGRANYLWHCMMNRCQKHPGYEYVEIKMTKNDWMTWAIPELISFWNREPTGIPSVHRKNDVGNYELNNIEIIDKKDNMIKSSFVVKSLHLNKNAPVKEKIEDVIKIVKWSLCQHLGVEVSQVIEALNVH